MIIIIIIPLGIIVTVFEAVFIVGKGCSRFGDD